ncbi:MAG: lamin tail domain-containing protein [Planctomycetales bacterium]|nr:lamin tail domain-containing protein [Planctomycetales bacterium]
MSTHLEIVNPSGIAVDVSGWRLAGGVEYSIAPGTVIPSGESLFITPSVLAFRQRNTGPSGNLGLFVHGPYSGHLSNAGETVELINPAGDVVASLTTIPDLSLVQQFLRASEIHYHLRGLDDGTEFIELTNISSGGDSVALDLTGVVISEGPSEPFTFDVGTTLPPGAYLVVVGDFASFAEAYPDVALNSIAGEFMGNLSNGGERLKVDDADGSTVVDFEFNDNDPWPVRADGVGSSLEIMDVLHTAVDQWNKAYHWRASTVPGGTPAAANSLPLGIVINEVLANFRGAFGELDAIEIVNATNTTFDLTNVYVSDTSSNFVKYAFPAGTLLPAGSHLVIDERQFNPTPANPGPRDFALDGDEGRAPSSLSSSRTQQDHRADND